MTTLFGTGSISSCDGELPQLRAENRALAEELSQCQADKDFVWSLWKRLQVASPDITQAVSLVVQREKEKAEMKDRKVLEILQHKDDKLDQLQKALAEHTQQLTAALADKVQFEDQATRWQQENVDLRNRNTSLETKLSELESREHQIGSRQAIRDLDKDILDLKQQLSKRDREMDDLRQDREDLTTIRDSQKQRLQSLEEDLSAIGKKHSDLAAELSEAKASVSRHEQQLAEGRREQAAKQQELDNARKELSELWQTHKQMTEHAHQQTDVIRQLQALQYNTNRIAKNQEDAFSTESSSLHSKFQHLQASELSLKQKLFSCRKRLSEQESLISDLKTTLNHRGKQDKHSQAALGSDDKDSQLTDPDSEVENKLRSLQTELDSLRRRLSHRSREGTCDKGSSPIRGSYPSPRRHSSSPDKSRNKERHGAASRSRERSQSRGRKERPHPREDEAEDKASSSPTDAPLQQKLHLLERKNENIKGLLLLKAAELEETRSAHRRRLERLNSLQASYRLIKKQMKMLEDEYHGPKKKKRRIPRAAPKALQKEDSDAVWNELAHFKNENRNLVIDRMNLQEELDTLRVQVAQDAATVHELRSCLEQEREELHFIVEQQEERERSSAPTPDYETELRQGRIQVKKLQKKCEKLVGQVKSLEDENRQLGQEREQLHDDRRCLRSEMALLSSREAGGRMRVADLNKDIARLQRELRRRPRKKRNLKSQAARQYQKILNQSISQMNQVFQDFGKDGWEEVSETDDATPELTGDTTEMTGTTLTSESLGFTIAHHARTNSFHGSGGGGGSGPSPQHTSTPSPQRSANKVNPSLRQLGSVDDHVRRMAQKQDAPAGDHDLPASSNIQGVQRADVALSPIHFQAAKPHVVSHRVHAPTPGGRQVASLKQRITALQQQVMILKRSKDLATKTSQDQRIQLEQLQSDLSLSNQRAHNSRLTLQRLQGDLERTRMEKEVMEKQLEEYSFNSSSTAQHSDTEWAMVNNRLKSSANEVSKQSALLKHLRTELEAKTDKIQQLQDRVNHVERDLSQKRTLVEDMRLKLKIAQENAQCDADVMLEVEERLKQLTEINSRQKTQMDCLRTRLAAVSKEKFDNEDKVFKLTDEIERKSKQAADFQRRISDLQSSIVAVEKTAQQQLQSLANQSEVAVDTAQSRLTQATEQLKEHDKFIKVFTHAMLNSVQQARSLWAQQQRRKVAALKADEEADPSLKKARHRACDILNISASDLEDIMSVEEEVSTKQGEKSHKQEESKKDKRWSKKMEKILSFKGDFAVTLTELLMTKMEERMKLAAKLQMT